MIIFILRCKNTNFLPYTFIKVEFSFIFTFFLKSRGFIMKGKRSRSEKMSWIIPKKRTTEK